MLWNGFPAACHLPLEQLGTSGPLLAIRRPVLLHPVVEFRAKASGKMGKTYGRTPFLHWTGLIFSRARKTLKKFDKSSKPQANGFPF
jgi:hypothetical protein